MQKFVFLFFLFSVNLALAQEKEHKFTWDETRPLTWSDFLGSPQSGEKYHASTNSGISYSWSLTTTNGEEEFIYEVRSNFYPNLSWVRNGKGTAHLLAHEQLHFDISELHARKLRREMKKYRISKDIKPELREIYRRIESERRDMQERFDKETRHSIDRESQREWQDYIRLELEKLKKFAN